MSEYVMGVVAVSILSALATFFAYGGGAARAVRAAISMIMIYTVCVPAVKLVSDISPEDFSVDISVSESFSDGEYIKVAERAFCDGVRSFISDKFNININEIEVVSEGFDFEKMCARKIKINLCGRSAMADTDRIRDAVIDAKLGDCEVNIKIG